MEMDLEKELSNVMTETTRTLMDVLSHVIWKKMGSVISQSRINAIFAEMGYGNLQRFVMIH